MKYIKIIVITSILYALAVTAYFLYSYRQYQSNKSKGVYTSLMPTIEEKSYRSETLNISFDYPAYFEVEEKPSTIYMHNQHGQITIDRTATNYPTLDGYISSLEKLNHTTFTNKQYITVNTIDALKTTSSYFLYPTSWTVYIVSSNSQILSADLDRIVHSIQFSLSKMPKTNTEESQNQVFTQLKFSINIPSSYTVSNNGDIVYISSIRGSLKIVREKTNVSTVSDYLSDYDKKKNIQVTLKNNLSIDGYEAKSRNNTYPDTTVERAYYIFIDKNIYILSTYDWQAFDDLDSVAYSFRYIH